MTAGKPGAGRRFIVSVGASSKNAGKSSLASFLVAELAADYGLKVSSGGMHDDHGVVDDPVEVAAPGTDTGALIRAGAKKVLWVSSPPERLEADLERALGMFPPGGTLVVEGNTALTLLESDFSVFVMNVHFDSFKPSAALALERADLVIVGLGRDLPESARPVIERELASRAPAAELLFYTGGMNEFETAMRQAADIIRGRAVNL